MVIDRHEITILETQRGRPNWAPSPFGRWLLTYCDHVNEWEPCANMPHAIFNAQIVYCPHDQSWSLYCMLGDAEDAVWSEQRVHYGPFDEIKDVASDLGKWLSVVGRRRLLEACLFEHARSINDALKR